MPHQICALRDKLLDYLYSDCYPGGSSYVSCDCCTTCCADRICRAVDYTAIRDDRTSFEFNAEYPHCTVTYPALIGNGMCDGGVYNTTECGWDGGDCIV